MVKRINLKDVNYRKLFIRYALLALIISALIGLFVFVFGENSDLEFRFLLTSFAIGTYGVTGLCCSAIISRKGLRLFSMLGIAVCFLAFLVSLALIWRLIETNELLWRIMGILVVTAICFSQIALMLLFRTKSKTIALLMTLTIVLVVFVSVLLIYSILNNFNESRWYYRILGISGTLMVLGLITTPLWELLLEKTGKSSN